MHINSGPPPLRGVRVRLSVLVRDEGALDPAFNQRDCAPIGLDHGEELGEEGAQGIGGFESTEKHARPKDEVLREEMRLEREDVKLCGRCRRIVEDLVRPKVQCVAQAVTLFEPVGRGAKHGLPRRQKRRMGFEDPGQRERRRGTRIGELVGSGVEDGHESHQVSPERLRELVHPDGAAATPEDVVDDVAARRRVLVRVIALPPMNVVERQKNFDVDASQLAPFVVERNPFFVRRRVVLRGVVVGIKRILADFADVIQYRAHVGPA
mmetsp:Transcript_256/g.758  ORF Transcript_256/g.758 Transcript_256/m.758 type:complete len:266 (-) Transcript_256:1307-2104(-)